MSDLDALRSDLAAEHNDLDSIVADISPGQWARPTPAAGWSLADQIGHLGYFDRAATLAIADPDGFGRHLESLMVEVTQAETFDVTLTEPRSLVPAALLAWWRQGRTDLLSAAADLTDDSRLVWYGPSMGARSFLTARLMETWAHGQDVADALGVERTPTDRLSHVAHLGVITRGFAYVTRGLEQPEDPVRVELAAPSGELWVWGPDDAASSVTGPAVDFCRVVTQRRHRDDTALVATGAAANDWLDVAQVFAGPPGAGRERLSAR